MLAPTSRTLFIVSLAIMLPSALSFPYSIYNMKSRRASRASGMKSDSGRSSSAAGGGSSSSSINNQAGYFEPRQQHNFDQSAYRSSAAAAAAAPPYFGNYDTLYDSGADSFYTDDESVDDRPEREYLYGKPTYHGEYKPTRYYYARAPSYSYYGDHMESMSTNPLDDLHEEMLQEDHNRQRNWPSNKDAAAAEWLQNANGQPSSLTGNFMKNLMLYNNGMNTQPGDMDAAAADAVAAAAAAGELPTYDDEEIENPYASELTNQNEPFDYFDPLKFQHVNQFNHFGSPSTNKQIYYNQENRKENDEDNDNVGIDGDDDDDVDNDRQRFLVKNKEKNQRKPATHHDNANEDKDEKDLESLRKNHNKNSSNRKNGGRGRAANRNAAKVDNDKHHSDKNKNGNDNYNGGYDTGFDYEDDQWINWNRKRSLSHESMRPLKALEQRLTEALKFQAEALTVTTTPPPPKPSPSVSASTSTASSNKHNNNDGHTQDNGVHKHKGQKEVVLSRPATPLRRHYPPNVLDALTKTVDEKNQANQMDSELHAVKNDGDKQHTSTHAAATAGLAATRKQKRYVSSEASLAQQLNGLKRKIKT